MSDETQIDTYDPNTLRDQVAAKIRACFVELVPEEAWKAMVEAEIKHFTTKPRSTYGTGPCGPSPIQEMIRAEIRSILAERIKKALGEPDAQGEWAKPWPTGSDVAKVVATECAPHLVQAMFAGIVQHCMEQIRQQMTQLT